MWTRVESAVPCVLEARHRTATSCRSLRHAAAGKGSSCSEPLARVAASPGGAGRGPPPPPSTQVRAGAGSPVAGQSSTPPVLLEKVKEAGSGSGKAGPWLSTSRVRPAQCCTRGGAAVINTQFLFWPQPDRKLGNCQNCALLRL